MSPEKKHYGSLDPWKSVVGEDRSGRPDKGTDPFETSDHYCMSNSWKASLQQGIQNWMMTVLGLLMSGKLILRCTSDLGDPMKLLGERQFCTRGYDVRSIRAT